MATLIKPTEIDVAFIRKKNAHPRQSELLIKLNAVMEVVEEKLITLRSAVEATTMVKERVEKLSSGCWLLQ